MKDSLVRLKEKFSRKKKKIPSLRCVGNYESFQAIKDCAGYGDNAILKKVIESTQKVLMNEAMMERDGIAFQKLSIPWHLLYSIERLSKLQPVRVLDIGGALGTHYLQVRSIKKTNLEWVIFEQENYVSAANSLWQNETFKPIFVTSPEVFKERFDLIYVGSALQYFDPFFGLLQKLLSCDAQIIIIDRTIWGNQKEKFVIKKQLVSADIVSSSYPVCLYNQNNVIELFNQQGFSLIGNVENSARIQSDEGVLSVEGLFFERK